ncbi:MAG: hypothetical protein ACP5T3_00865 [Candidatus Micrarchaeia archaeon]
MTIAVADLKDLVRRGDTETLAEELFSEFGAKTSVKIVAWSKNIIETVGFNKNSNNTYFVFATAQNADLDAGVYDVIMLKSQKDKNRLFILDGGKPVEVPKESFSASLQEADEALMPVIIVQHKGKTFVYAHFSEMLPGEDADYEETKVLMHAELENLSDMEPATKNKFHKNFTRWLLAPSRSEYDLSLERCLFKTKPDNYFRIIWPGWNQLRVNQMLINEEKKETRSSEYGREELNYAVAFPDRHGGDRVILPFAPDKKFADKMGKIKSITIEQIINAKRIDKDSYNDTRQRIAAYG